MPELTRARSMLFMPGSRADMIAKVPRFAPDVAVVDLEDAVAAGDKASARRTAAAAIDALGPENPSTVLVRVNPVGTPWFAADVAAAAGCAEIRYLPGRNPLSANRPRASTDARRACAVAEASDSSSTTT